MSSPRVFVIGSMNMDLVIEVQRLPKPGETITGGDLALFPGGKGANQASAAGRLGGQTAMIACVGADAFGERLKGSLGDAGVDTALVAAVERPTGCASIYVQPNGENSIVISPGANAALDPAAAEAGLKSLSAGDFLLAQLESPLETVEAAFRLARSAGAITILDPAPARPLPECILRHTDYLTPNQTEAAVLLGRPELDISSFDDAEAAAGRLQQLGPRTVVMKLGALGCLVRSEGPGLVVPGFRVTAVDTTAAGDVFNGAFAVALSEGKPLPQAAAFANAAAAISVTRRGAQASIPGRAEVDAFLQQAAVAAD